MSDTPTDMAKVTQMLDSGWTVTITKGGLNSYYVTADHSNKEMMGCRAIELGDQVDPALRLLAINTAFQTDDFTPEQALTRMAYKVLGEII